MDCKVLPTALHCEIIHLNHSNTKHLGIKCTWYPCVFSLDMWLCVLLNTTLHESTLGKPHLLALLFKLLEFKTNLSKEWVYMNQEMFIIKCLVIWGMLKNIYFIGTTLALALSLLSIALTGLTLQVILPFSTVKLLFRVPFGSERDQLMSSTKIYVSLFPCYLVFGNN